MRKILVVEDEALVRENLIELLEAEGFHAIAAENGIVGIQLAQEHFPDLIICDSRMPELDGAGVLQSLRQDPTTAAIPFIFLTANAEKSALRQGMDLGADDYLVKPYRAVELLQAISARLTKHLVVTQLQQQVQELQDLSSLKDEFLCEASHDLRAPLTNMKMAIQLLKIADNEEQRKRYLKLLEMECDRETALLNDLLDLQRLEAKAFSVSLQPLSLEYWLPYILEPFESRIQERQQILKVELECDLPPITTDPTSLERVLTELINNACKYTATKGEIIFSIHHRVDHSNTLNLASEFIFKVSNQGEISAQDLSHIFEKFYRVSNASVSYQSGTGLGLALVQKLVEQMTGKIHAESSHGWTTFAVHLPAKP